MPILSTTFKHLCAIRSVPPPRSVESRLFRFGILLFTLCMLAGTAVRADNHLLIFAAASLHEIVDAASKEYCAQRGCSARVSYAASSTLARQIEAGAPAQVYLSADVAWMDYLDERGLIDRASRVDVARNSLVLIAPADSATTLRIAPNFDLAGALKDDYLAMGDPAHVPAGLYGRAALEHLGVWLAVARRVARAADVRAALALVARGEAGLGVVYGSDAAAEPRVRVVDIFPEDSHPNIVYPAATVRGRVSREASGFVRFLAGARGAALFARYGFLPVDD